MLLKQNIRYAGFWIRLVAEIIDSTLITIASLILQAVMTLFLQWIINLIAANSSIDFFSKDAGATHFIINGFLYMLLAAPYYILGHYRFGTTLGKKPFGIYVVCEKKHGALSLKKSIIRCLGYIPSYIFGIGFIMAASHPKKQALHDVIAGTVSVILKKTDKIS